MIPKSQRLRARSCAGANAGAPETSLSLPNVARPEGWLPIGTGEPASRLPVQFGPVLPRIGLSVAVRLFPPELLEHEHPQSGRKVGIAASGLDGADEIRQRQASLPGN